MENCTDCQSWTGLYHFALKWTSKEMMQKSKLKKSSKDWFNPCGKTAHMLYIQGASICNKTLVTSILLYWCGINLWRTKKSQIFRQMALLFKMDNKRYLLYIILILDIYSQILTLIAQTLIPTYHILHGKQIVYMIHFTLQLVKCCRYINLKVTRCWNSLSSSDKGHAL